jgi:hypothetical protein
LQNTFALVVARFAEASPAGGAGAGGTCKLPLTASSLASARLLVGFRQARQCLLKQPCFSKAKAMRL